MVLQDCFSLRARIGWQGLRADEFLDYGPYLVTGTDFSNGKVNWDTCYHVTEERYKQDTGIQLHEHDLLVTKDGTIGKTAIVQNCPEKATLNSGVFVVRATNKSVVPAYLYYVLSSRDFEIFLANTLTGSTIKHLNQEHFYKFKFSAPELIDFIANDIKPLGREKQKEFLSYGLSLFHNALFINNGLMNNVLLPEDEKAFLKNFAPFISNNNIDLITELFEESINQIETGMGQIHELRES